MTEEEAIAALAPIVHYTAEQHEMAMLRYLLERLFDEVFELHCRSESISHDELKAQLNTLAYACDAGGGDLELEDALTEHFKFNAEAFVDAAENEIHCGDCTASCFMCMRCHAERYYGACTAPVNKSIGSALLHHSINLRKQREQNESTTES